MELEFAVQKIESAILGTQKNAQIVKVEDVSDGTVISSLSAAFSIRVICGDNFDFDVGSGVQENGMGSTWWQK